VAAIRRAVSAALLLTVAICAAPGTAHADVITPAGACVGSGHWVKSGQTERSTAHQPSDVITVPRTDTVQWAGNIKGFALGAVGPRRPISGEVQLDLPIGSVTIDSWGRTSVRYANQGEHHYDLPAILSGIKMKLHGQHRESGRVVCSGSVFVKVKGSNPLVFGALGLLVISGGMLFFAGRPVFRKLWAFEDVNPG